MLAWLVTPQPETVCFDLTEMSNQVNGLTSRSCWESTPSLGHGTCFIFCSDDGLKIGVEITIKIIQGWINDETPSRGRPRMEG